MFFKTYGILGINARSLKYIKVHNNKVARALADSKLKTKDFLGKKGVNVPKTLSVLKHHSEINNEVLSSLELPFVVKPNNGFGGKGILVFDEMDHSGSYITNTGLIYTKEKLSRHLSHILDGFYSLSGNRDKVMIEKKIVLNNDVALLGKYGLPDVRIILFNMIPVMAMIRIPTEKSGGKANLHSGACAAGIDIGSGKLTYTTQHSRLIKSVPGIGNVRGIKLPMWDEILHLAVKVQQVTQIGYLGCDIVLDESEGPLLLEMNIRPGLEVQIANNAALHTRLKKVEGIQVNTVEKGVRLGRDLFSGDLEERVKNITGKKILGLREYISLERRDKKYKYIADIVPSKQDNYINEGFVRDVLKFENVQEGVRFRSTILGETRSLRFLIKHDLPTNITIGSKSIRGFLLDPFKYKKGELPIDMESLNQFKIVNSSIIKNYKEKLQKIDKQLLIADKKLIILKNLIPKNIEQEKKKFIESEGTYIPQFEYNVINIDFSEKRKLLEKIEIPDIPLSEIYIDKKNEIKNKINFLEAFIQGDYKNISYFSKEIYGDIVASNLEKALGIIKQKGEIEEEQALAIHEIKGFVKKFNHIYSINLSVTEREGGSRFAMKGNKLMVRYGAKVGKKELRGIIAHEIEGHFLRKMNGKKQGLPILGLGTAGYVDTEEGIAIYNQNRFLTPKSAKYYGIYERYYFINYALKHSYKKLVNKMIEYYNNDYDRVFTYLLRLKRGYRDISKDGVFFKDVVYLNGYVDVENYLNQGGDLKDLYIGKIRIPDLELLKKSGLNVINKGDLKLPFFL